MKKYILIVLSLITVNSFAQQFTITDKFDYSNNVKRRSNGYYYKDVTGYFDQFIGTWEHQNGNDTYILKFEKKTFTESFPHMNTTYMYDDLVGALKIIKNRVEVYDDLATLNQNYLESVKYNIALAFRVENYNDCYQCTYPKQRLWLSYSEINNDNFAFLDLGILIHTYTQNGVTKLRFNFRSDQVNPDAFMRYDDFDLPPTKTELFLPFGTFDFVRVP